MDTQESETKEAITCASFFFILRNANRNFKRSQIVVEVHYDVKRMEVWQM